MDQKLDGLRQGEKLSPMSPPGQLLCPGPAEHPRLISPQQHCAPQKLPPAQPCASPGKAQILTHSLQNLPSSICCLQWPIHWNMGGTHGAGGQRYTFWSILDLQKDFVCRF